MQGPDWSLMHLHYLRIWWFLWLYGFLFILFVYDLSYLHDRLTQDQLIGDSWYSWGQYVLSWKNGVFWGQWLSLGLDKD